MIHKISTRGEVSVGPKDIDKAVRWVSRLTGEPEEGLHYALEKEHEATARRAGTVYILETIDA